MSCSQLAAVCLCAVCGALPSGLGYLTWPMALACPCPAGSLHLHCCCMPALRAHSLLVNLCALFVHG